MPRVQGCLLHTTSLPYIYTKFPRRDPSRGNRLYFCMELSFPDRRNRWVICSKHHKYKTIFSFRASFFGSGIKKPPDFSGGRGQSLCDNQANFMAVNSLAKRSTPFWILSIVLRLGLRLPCRKWPSCAWLTPVIFSSPEREKTPAYSERKLAVS